MGFRKYYFLIFLLVPILVSVSLVDEAFASYHKQPQQPMSVSTDKISYNFGDILTINGQGAQSYSISVIIFSPSGEEITEISTFKTSAGEFSTIWIIPSGIEKGTYTIEVRDSTQTAQTTFTIGKPSGPTGIGVSITNAPFLVHITTGGLNTHVPGFHCT